MSFIVALFGEAEKGEYATPIFCKSLIQLIDQLGNPPKDSQGISFAIQALLYQKELIFFRVREEGFSVPDYQRGLKVLLKGKATEKLSALCMPGVGDGTIILAAAPVCQIFRSLLIVQEKDLYDYLTHLA